MTKQFTVNVPDELWVDSWTENRTMSWTYEGPERIYVKLRHDFTVAEWSDSEFDPETVQSNEKVIELDSATSVDVMFYLTNQGQLAEHEFEDETNPDGSIYKKISNPNIYDIFYIDYDDQQGFSLKAIYKAKDTFGELRAREKLTYVKTYDDLYDFDEETQAAIDKFIADTEQYLSDMAGIYPWKYVTLPDNSPRIPALLIEKFKPLPSQFGGNIQ
jgi:hypothetical protein